MEEEMTVEDIANDADDKVEVLIELLVAKGILTREEFDQKYGELFED